MTQEEQEKKQEKRLGAPSQFISMNTKKEETPEEIIRDFLQRLKCADYRHVESKYSLFVTAKPSIAGLIATLRAYHVDKNNKKQFQKPIQLLMNGLDRYINTLNADGKLGIVSKEVAICAKMNRAIATLIQKYPHYLHNNIFVSELLMTFKKMLEYMNGIELADFLKRGKLWETLQTTKESIGSQYNQLSALQSEKNKRMSLR